MSRTSQGLRGLTLVGVLLGALSPSNAQSVVTSAFTQRLVQNRYSLAVRGGEFTGSGAVLLQSAIAQSRFVLVGEDHGLAETAQFWEGICSSAARDGFHDMAIEEGPLVAAELERWISEPDGEGRVAAFQKQYPASINIYGTKQEFEMLVHCAHAAGMFHLWGLNQEVLGAAGFILTRILETKPQGQAEAAMCRLLKLNDDAKAKALETGRMSDLYMLTAEDRDLAEGARLLREGGGPQARSLFASLVESHQINSLSPADPANARRRSLLMWRLFSEDYAKRSKAEQGPPKVLLKFGAYHVYRGQNPVHGTGIGNQVAQLAGRRGANSLHIRLLPVAGSFPFYPRLGQPQQHRSFNLRDDPGSRYLDPMLDNLLPSDWTVFDLRPLRRGFSTLSASSPALANLISGIDILVMVPKATPGTEIR